MLDIETSHLEIYDHLKQGNNTSLFNHLEAIDITINQVNQVIDSPEERQENLPVEIKYYVSELIDILKNNFESLRKSQVISIVAIIDHLLEWKTSWLIKLPTWMWKTKLFSEIIEWLQLSTAIFIPNNHLKWQVKEYFNWSDTFVVWEDDTVVNSVVSILDTIMKKNIEAPVIICSYKALLQLKSDDVELFQEFSSCIELIIRDEAHKSLWDETSEALDQVTLRDNEYLTSSDYALDWSNSKLELLFTATPNLLSKSIRESYETIISLRLQDWVEEWILHIPEFIRTPKALINLWDQSINQTNIDKNALKFCDIDWNLSYLQLIDKYIELKDENNGYFPWIWFCRDIGHAEFMKSEMEKKWIRTVRITSGNKDFDKGVSEEDWKNMLEKNEIDFVITVMKVAEWWDVPTLRSAINFTPIFSESKYMQWIWRILRVLEYHEWMKQLGITQKDNAVIIEPESWDIYNQYELSDDENIVKETTENNLENLKNKSKFYHSKENKNFWKTISGLMHMVKSWEFDRWFLEETYWDLSWYINTYKLDNDWTVEIEWIMYTAATTIMDSTNSQLLCSWWIALNRIDKQSEEWKEEYILKSSWKRWPQTVDLYNLEELLKILPDHSKTYKLNEDRTIKINGIMYTAITHWTNFKNSKLLCNWSITMRIVNQQSEEWCRVNILEQSWIIWTKIVDLCNLEQLLKILPKHNTVYELNVDKIVEIDWITYTSVTSRMTIDSSRLPCNWPVAWEKINQQSEEWKEKNILRKSWKNKWKWSKVIDLYNLKELLKILPKHNELYELNEDKTVEIDWIIYTSITHWMSPDNSKLSCSWLIALKKTNKKSEEWVEKNVLKKSWKNWIYTLDLYNLEEVLRILPKHDELYKLDENGIVEIEGTIYTSIVRWTNSESSKLPCSRLIALKKINQQSEEWVTKNMLKASWTSKWKWSKSLDLYNLEELLKILPKINELYELNEEKTVEVEGIIYTAIILNGMTPQNSKLPNNWRQTFKQVSKQSKEWFEKNVLKASWKRGSQIIDLYNLNEVLKLLK